MNMPATMSEDALLNAVRSVAQTDCHLDGSRLRFSRQAAVLQPAPAEVVAATEHALGGALPPLLRRLYLEIGNGGFGPGYCLLPLANADSQTRGRTALGLYRDAHEDPADSWAYFPPALLPLCPWGCGIYSLVDCSTPEGRMWSYDPNPTGEENSLFPEPYALAEWLRRWVHGTLNQPTLYQDPDTGQWRAITDADFERMAASARQQDQGCALPPPF